MIIHCLQIFPEFIPVSYTHLNCFWTERIKLQGTWEEVILVCVPVLDSHGMVRGICGLETVSYTHLDVYKRQDSISLDGSTGAIYDGIIPTVDATIAGEFGRIMGRCV